MQPCPESCECGEMGTPVEMPKENGWASATAARAKNKTRKARLRAIYYKDPRPVLKTTTSCARGIFAFGIHAQIGERRHCLLRVKFAVARQAGQRRGRYRFGIDLEVPAQVLAIVAASEAIGAQRLHPPGKPRRQLV